MSIVIPGGGAIFQFCQTDGAASQAASKAQFQMHIAMKTLEIISNTEENELADHDITAAVERLFTIKNGVAAHLIDVTATQGIVTLSGYSDNLLARERAEEIAKAVRGVRGVINKIGVRGIDLPDATLRRDVEEALLQDAVACEFTIGCTVCEG